ncbi:MAG: effector binding domain-containing protein [Promethearchaeota archaeon]
MRAAFFYDLSEAPEENCWKKAKSWAEKKGLLEKNANTRIFGRNIYPTENPEPHGYGFYITITPDTKIESDILVRLLPGGLYAVARCEGLEQMGLIWPILWDWVKNSKYEYIGETKEEYGYELGLEEILNWLATLVEESETKFILDLMIPLWEK